MPKALANTVATATITLSTMLKVDGFLGCCSIEELKVKNKKLRCRDATCCVRVNRHFVHSRTCHATSLQIIIHNSKLTKWIEFIIATTGTTTAIVGITAIG